MIAAMRIERSKLPRWLLWVVGVIAAWAMFAVLLILQLLPDTPKTTRGWVLLLVFGPPAYALLEWAAGRRSAKAGAQPSQTRFSFARVGVALLVLLVMFAAFTWWFLRAGR
jgi:hypothetical protein